MKDFQFKKPWRMKLASLAVRVAWWLARPGLAGVPVGKHYDIVVELKGEAVNGGRALRVDGGTLILDSYECIVVRSHEETELIDAIEHITNGESDA